MQLPLLKQIDLLGTLVMAISITCLVMALERGNTENWFDSELIVRLIVISVLFLALFCWIELQSSQPLINLRLLQKQNFALCNILDLAVGFMLGYPYVVMQYLYEIQGYNLLQIGRVLVWGSIINPALGKLIEYVESRLLLAIALGAFVTSCFMNSRLSYDVAAHELFWSQLVRATGLPMSIAVIAFIATDNVKKEQADSVSAIFNMVRTMAATVGTATLGTLIEKREQFHSSRLVEHISTLNFQTRDRLQEFSQLFTNKVGYPNIAQFQATATVRDTVRREAYIMAYSDSFYVIGALVFLTGIAVLLFLKKTRKPGESPN